MPQYAGAFECGREVSEGATAPCSGTVEEPSLASTAMIRLNLGLVPHTTRVRHMPGALAKPARQTGVPIDEVPKARKNLGQNGPMSLYLGYLQKRSMIFLGRIYA